MRKNAANLALNPGVITNLYEEGTGKNRYKELKLSLQNKINESEMIKNQHSQLSQYEISLREAKKYYKEKYGRQLLELSDFVQSIESYMKVILLLLLSSKITYI